MLIRKQYIPILKGIDLSIRRLPMLIADSGKLGPVLWLTAAIHGDEVTGTAVVHSIFKRLQLFPLVRGKIFAFPILNPSGFETISRRELYTEMDLNRSFEGIEESSTADRLASLILATILTTKPISCFSRANFFFSCC